jgi:hypothetical protein
VRCERQGRPPPTSKFRAGHEGYTPYEFTIPNDAGERVALCRLLWDLADDDAVTERLLWLVGWSVWPTGEHMPLFKTLRRALGEERELIEIPGHLIDPSEAEHGLSLLIVTCLFLWDGWLYSRSGVVIELSNDEVGTVYEPSGAAGPDRRAALEPFMKRGY